MQIANLLASYSLGEADLLRRAMGKKNAEAMAEQRDRFQSGAAALGHPKGPVAEIFDQMDKVLRLRLQQISFRRLRPRRLSDRYLKTHYPVEFMAALLTSETSKPRASSSTSASVATSASASSPPTCKFQAAIHAARYFRGASNSLRSRSRKERRRQRHRVHHQSPRRSRRTLQEPLGVLRKSRPARHEQARHRVAHQGRRARLTRHARPAHGRRR